MSLQCRTNRGDSVEGETESDDSENSSNEDAGGFAAFLYSLISGMSKILLRYFSLINSKQVSARQSFFIKK